MIKVTAYPIIIVVTFRVLRQTQLSDSATAAPTAWEPLSTIERSFAAPAPRGLHATDDPGEMVASPSDGPAAVREQEHGYAAGVISELEAATTGALRLLVIEAAPARLSAWISDRGHKVTLLDPADTAPQTPEGDAAAAMAAMSRPPRLIARCVQLPFRDECFDVVVWVPAFEGVPPGCDRVALWDIARVLTPTGRLVMTFEVMSQGRSATDQRGVEPNAFRTFRWTEIQRLVDHISQSFVVSQDDLPAELEKTTFTPATPTGPDRGQDATPVAAANPVRWTIGTALARRPDSARPPTTALIAGYIEGQVSLQHRADAERSTASRWALLVSQLEAQIANMAEEISTAQVDRDEMASLAEVRLTIMREQSRAVDEFHVVAEERLDVIRQLEARAAELQRACDERLAVIAGLDRAARERLDLITSLAARCGELEAQLK
jgi:hypothetical protein